MSHNVAPALRQSNRYAKAYFGVFLMTIILMWLPFKVLAYGVPFLSIGWFILASNSGKTLMRLIAVISIFLAFILFYYTFYLLQDQDFIVQNSLLFLITYGSFLFLAILPRSAAFHTLDYRNYMKIIGLIILMESALGIFQVSMYIVFSGGNFDSAAGDFAQGTLDPLSFITPEANLNNQIYTANLLTLLLFYTPHAIARRNGRWISIMGFVAVLFAAVWHIVFSFLVALFIITLLFSYSFIRISPSRVFIAVFLVLLIGISSMLQPKNFGLVSYYIDEVTSFESLKATATIESLTELPQDYRWVPYIGLGPGQYCSRAGLIGSGHYFGNFSNPTRLPLLEAEASPAFEKYIYPKWEEFATNPGLYGNSTMSRPFHSLLSLVVELGYVFFGLLVLGILLLLNRIKKLYHKAAGRHDKLTSLYCLSCGTLIAFLIFISLFENYLEVAHAIFLGLLLFRYFLSYINCPGEVENSTNH